MNSHCVTDVDLFYQMEIKLLLIHRKKEKRNECSRRTKPVKSSIEYFIRTVTEQLPVASKKTSNLETKQAKRK